MNIRVRLILLISGIVILGSGLGLWQFAGTTREVETENAIRASVREAATAKQLALLQNDIYRDGLYDLVSREQSARSMGVSPTHDAALTQFLDTSMFQGVALLKFDKERWKVDWFRLRTQVVGRWPDGFFAGLLTDLPIDRATAGAQTWFRATDQSQQTIFCLLSAFKLGNEQVVAVGILPATAFQAVTNVYLGTGTEMSVIDERGFALAFTEQAYVGANLVEAVPAVDEALKKREVSRQFTTTNREKQKIQVAAQRIEGTNLYAIAGVLQPSVMPVFWRLGFVSALMALAILLIGIGAGVWILQPLEAAVKYLSDQIANVAAGRPVSYFEAGNPYLGKLKDSVERLVSGTPGEAPEFIKEATAQEVEGGRMNAYKEISVGLAQALKDPLAAVLAQSQLARARAGSPELKEHFIVIEREARRARDTMDELLRMTGEDQFPRSRIEIQDVVLGALAAQKGLLASHNVKVNKELAQSISLQAHTGQLQTALEEVIKNAVEAMGSSPERSLKLRSAQVDGWLQLRVEDTGRGVKTDNLAKIFDPFFTTKDTNTHKGLGLTVAKGILKSFGGRVRIESAGENAGAAVIFEFPAPTLRAVGEATAPKIQLKTEIDMPLTGTEADHLPTAPALDEVTLTGLKIEAEHPLPPSEMTMRPPKIKEGNS